MKPEGTLRLRLVQAPGHRGRLDREGWPGASATLASQWIIFKILITLELGMSLFRISPN